MEKDACVTRFIRRAQIAVELMNLAGLMASNSVLRTFTLLATSRF